MAGFVSFICSQNWTSWIQTPNCMIETWMDLVAEMESRGHLQIFCKSATGIAITESMIFFITK